MLKACNSEVFKNYTSFDHTCNQGIWCTEWPPCLKSLDFGGYPAALRIQSQKLFVTVLYTCKQKRRSMEGKENKTHQCQFGLNMTNFVLTSMSSGSLPKFFIWYWGRSLLIWSCKPGNNKKKRLRRSSRCIFAACFHSSESSFGLESIFSGSWHGSSLIGIAPVSVTFGGQSNWMTSAGFFNLQKLDWLAAATNSDQIKRRQHYSTTYFFLNSPPDQDSQDIRDTTSWISVQIPAQLVAISKHSRPGNAVSQHPRWTCVSCPVTPGSLSKQIA